LTAGSRADPERKSGCCFDFKEEGYRQGFVLGNSGEGRQWVELAVPA